VFPDRNFLESMMTDTPSFRPPTGLRAGTRRWFVAVSSSWDLEEHHLRQLAIAARSWDQAEEADELVRREGLVIQMPSGASRPHPAIRIGNEARALFLRALRELDLDLEPPAATKRPPMLRSVKGGPHAA
jgi:hypothetical protein